MSESREVTAHHVGKEVEVRIFATGPLNPGGANNSYVVGEVAEEKITNCLGVIQFQSGHPGEQGRNGVTLEALLAICLDRLQSFQHGPFPSRYNESALQNIERAIESLKDRTREQERNNDLTK